MRKPIAVFQDTHDIEKKHISENVTTTKETMEQRITRIRRDMEDLNHFYNIQCSPRRIHRFQDYYNLELASLKEVQFEKCNQEEKIDYLLLRNLLERKLKSLDLERSHDRKTEPLIPFAAAIIQLCEDRQGMKSVNGQKAAQAMQDLAKQVSTVKEKIEQNEFSKIEISVAFRAGRTVNRLRKHLNEWFCFFNGYDPLFSWWVKAPFEKADTQLKELASKIQEKLVGIGPDDHDTIIGDPVGRDGILDDLQAEQIAYTPEELIKIGETEYEWCEKEMKKASHALGYGNDWKKALEFVKNTYVDPGKQPDLIRDLHLEATEYVQKHDMITVPPLAVETIRVFMMTPEAQKVNPFFLGGDSIIVSYPTDTMDHDDKLMSMRGNSKATFEPLVGINNLLTGITFSRPPLL
jgi:hypothetical protein